MPIATRGTCAMPTKRICSGPAAPAQSYLNVEQDPRRRARSGAQAIHPGYGFLAENAAFARDVIAAGSIWIGPHPDAIDAMGDKIALAPGDGRRGRAGRARAGPSRSARRRRRVARGRALRPAARAQSLGRRRRQRAEGRAHARRDRVGVRDRAARSEAYFKNATIYAERYLDNPKHVELQILADKHGNVVHVGERDCSLQRRHQKLWEEAPARISEAVRDRLREAGVRAARAIGYD